MRQWDTATVDQILIEGDRMYLNALESQSIPDTDTLLSLIYLPNQGRSTVQSPAIEFTEQKQSPVEVTKSPSEANNSRQSPVEAKTILKKSPITVTNTDLPIMVEPDEAQINANDNPLWSVEYKEYYQGRVNCDEYENEGPYLTLRSALMNAFNDNNFAFIILEGYTVALINTGDCIYVFDSHARNNFGMPDPNGTAVVMKCDDVSHLEQYLCSLSIQLNAECFEVVPVEFYAEHSKAKCISASNVFENSRKRKRLEKTVCEKEKTLQKAREYKKRKILEETESVKQTRLQRKRDFQNAKKLSETETDRKIRLEKDNYHKRKFAEESEEAKKVRLKKARLNYWKGKEKKPL